MPYTARGQECGTVLIRNALEMERRTLPVGHARISATLIHHASALARLGRCNEAEVELREVVRMRQAFQANDPTSMAEAKVRLADFLGFQRKDFVAAEALYREALALLQQVYGQRHLRLVHVLGSLADLQEAQGKGDESERLWREIVTIRRSSLGRPNGAVAWSIGGLAGLLHRQHRYAEAEALFREEIAEYGASLGPNHPTIAGALAELLGDLFDRHAPLRRSGQSDPAGDRAPRGSVRIDAWTHPGVSREARASVRRAGSLRRGGVAADARARDRGSAVAHSHDNTKGVLRGFVNLYEAWDRPADAEGYRRRLR